MRLNFGKNYDPVTLLITDRGSKFEGQPRWVSHFYDLWSASEPGQHKNFYVNAEDQRQFPELWAFYAIELYEDDGGCVWGKGVAEPPAPESQS